MSAPRRTVQTSFDGLDRPGQRTLEEAAAAPPPSPGLTVSPAARIDATPAPTRAPPLRRVAVPSFLGEEAAPTVHVPATAPMRSPQRELAIAEPPAGPATEAIEVRGIPLEIAAHWHRPPGFELRELQVRSVDEFLARHRGTVIVATGGGKTEIAIEAIYRLKLPAIILVPTRVLLTQWRAAFARWGIRAGAFYGEEKSPDFVTVALYQSLFRNPEAIRDFPVVVFDEGDMVTAEDWSAILREAQIHPYALLLSATLPSENERRRALERALPILYRAGVKENIAAGNLVPAIIVPVGVRLTGPEQVRYDGLTKSLTQLLRALRAHSVAQVARLTRSHDPEMRQKAFAYLKRFSERRSLLAYAEAKRDALVQIVRAHPREMILVFSTNVEPLEAACAAVNGAMGSGYCRVISGETREAVRREIIDGFGRAFYVLGSADVLRRGFNVPSVAVAVFLAAGAGRGDLTQRLGRVLRSAPGKTRAEVYVTVADGTVDENTLDTLRTLAGDGDTPTPAADDVE